MDRSDKSTAFARQHRLWPAPPNFSQRLLWGRLYGMNLAYSNSILIQIKSYTAVTLGSSHRQASGSLSLTLSLSHTHGYRQAADECWTFYTRRLSHTHSHSLTLSLSLSLSLSLHTTTTLCSYTRTRAHTHSRTHTHTHIGTSKRRTSV